MRARLTVVAGNAKPPICELQPDSIVRLGRKGTNHVVLSDQHASREHAELYRDESGCWVVRDCPEITNPTRVDGRKIQAPTRLENGQVIAIGEARLRFNQDPSTISTESLPVLPQDSVSDSTTTLHVDELETLLAFTTEATNELTAPGLVRLALTTVLRQTRAALCGFLSLDANDPLPRIVLPSNSPVDQPLSRRLTQQAIETGQLAWLCAPNGPSLITESLASFRDAVCVPLRASPPGSDAATPQSLGALHVYKLNQAFSEREVRFCEMLARSLAGSLLLLLGRRALEADNDRLRKSSTDLGHDLIGDSQVMQDIRHQLDCLAAKPYTVRIVGESGVGKELVAQALHKRSDRRDGPFVAVNCAAIVGSMAESLLFGHIKGAFTGAVKDHPGYFQQADLGTLFLDEVGELPLELQSKLLRAINEQTLRTIHPVGASEPVKVDVRIITATNRNLDEEVRAQKFRNDLKFRLGVPLEVPPLRERREDIPALATHLLERENARFNRHATLTARALERLVAYYWPGNIRELRTVLEHSLALTPGDVIDAQNLQIRETQVDDRDALPMNLAELEAYGIRRALALTGFNNTAAAQLLGINRDTLIQKVKRYGIVREE